jgi:hypothetical protein
MPDGLALELASLSQRHPDLEATLLSGYAMMAVIRLKLDPPQEIPLSLGGVSRRITISHRSEGLVDDSVLEREIGWIDLGFTEIVSNQIKNTCNSNEITEKAAIAVMGLLVHELEKIQIKQVLQIGSGGDFVANYIRSGRPIQVEVSGIREGQPSDSRFRLTQKREQVLKTDPRGFVSVTTFHQIGSGGGIVHSFLHYVESSTPSRASPKGGSPRKRR